MNQLVSLESSVDNQILEDASHERASIVREINSIKHDYEMRPSQKVRKLNELREALRSCNSDLEIRAHEILQNFI